MLDDASRGGAPSPRSPRPQTREGHRIEARRLPRLRSLARTVGALIAVLALAAACTTDGAAPEPPTPPATPASSPTPTGTPDEPAPVPTPTPTPSPDPAAAPVSRPAPTDAGACRETPADESRPDCYYDGPLFDAHFHPYDAFDDEAGEPDDALCRLLQRDGVTWGLALYELPPNPADAEHRRRIIEGSRACTVPLVQPMYGVSSQPGAYDGFRRGEYSEEMLEQWLAPRGPLQGVGELALYFPELHDVRLDHPVVQTALEAVDAIGGVAMIHPRIRGSHHAPVATYPNPTTAEEIAAALERYPDTTFVLHGGLPLWDMLEPLFNEHPNLYFSYETVFWFMEAHLPFSLVAPERFIRELDEFGLDRLMEQTIAELAPRLEEHPDRVMWGLDRYRSWHFQPEVSERWLEVTRLMIARLPEETQAPYAYENALRVLGPYLDPPAR